ncbi:hypothetical protein FOXG_16913 [Fusarium oxysporum f. sp. lycopersici 4287]|uniref:Uncharacterized protein n=2 Tax=Fusarium oxysporum TaxID=5507 RepID=A0A0J9WA32_FUSO4|nr:hypothetical protein FOXG_16913 [Fusarium oxysporum f. sp. lycopersici 4287]KNB19693.1 hypothetical protein FOXG_16913 [Fusarium oxysporum f. sp. lycopersici 4287]
MSADAPQYQHFIPQFILKNFDHPFSCPKAPTNQNAKSTITKKENTPATGS